LEGDGEGGGGEGGGGGDECKRVLVEKAKYKRPRRKPRRKWEDNIKMYFRDMACISVHWIHMDQFRKK